MIIDEAGKKERVPGILKYVKAIGVELNAYNITQVSLNLTNYKITSLHKVFETIKAQAKEHGVEATGSEVIGLVPKEALIEAGAFYTGNNSEDNLIEAAIEHLGLSQLNKFEPEKKIIENNRKFIILDKISNNVLSFNIVPDKSFSLITLILCSSRTSFSEVLLLSII